MASDCGDGDYLGAYRRFFEDFVAQVDPDDQLPVKVSSYDLTEAEISGEIIDWTLQYLNQKYCPPSLQSYLVHRVMEDVKLLCSKQPESCGWRFQEKTFAPLRLMHAVTNKVNEICMWYLDNSRLALLPPPPSTPIPLVSRCAIKNSRRKMEDRHVVIHDLHAIFNIQDDSTGSYYAVFDGHAGQDAAVYCAAHLHQYLAESIHYPTDPERALRDAFLTTDAHFIEKSNKQNLNSGTTAVCALLLNRKLYVAWVGDSQAVLAKRGQITQLVNPHKPDRDDERERVHDMGGTVLHWGIWRVNGQLAVSRAIGDVQYKPYVTGDPDIRCISLDGTEDFLIVACDGLWDYVSEAMATTLVYQQLREDPCDLETVSQRLVHFARSQGSSDNISTIVVFLTNPRQIAARHPASHPLLADVQLNNMESTNPFLSNANNGIQFDANPFGKQQQQQQQGTNGTCAENEENLRCSREHFEAPSNGKRANGAAGFDDNGDDRGNNDDEDEDEDEDDDLGPETDVDAVDEGIEVSVVPPTTDNLSRELFPEKLDDREDFEETGESRDDDPSRKERLAGPTRTEEADQHALIPDADNVADSEDSEDEWNYYPNKEKERITITGEGGERKDDKLSTSPKSVNEEDIREERSEAGLDLGDSRIEKEIEELEPIESEISADTESPEERNRPELEDDMDFQLNPNAAEFVPVSPPKILSTRANLNDDFLLSGSPQKQTPEMDDIAVPSQGEFQVEVSLRPHETERSNGRATKELPQTDFTDYLMDRQKSGNGTALGLDESEVSSTKAEFGDESTTSFLTATDFQKTGISLADDSFTGSEREDYDIAKDPMAMSFTPGDFQAAFEKEGDDLNVIHQLNESDLIGDEDAVGIADENFTAQSPDLHPELTTLVTPDTDHPPPTAAFPDSKNENLLELAGEDVTANENQSRPTSPEPLIKNETSLISGMVELIPSSCVLGSRSPENDSKTFDQASEETRYHALDTSSPLEGHLTPEETPHIFCTVSDKAESLLNHADIENNVSPIPSAAAETETAISPAPGVGNIPLEVASLLQEQLPSSPLPDVTIEKSSPIPDLSSFAATASEDQKSPLFAHPASDAELQEFVVDTDVQPATADIDSFLDTPPAVSTNQLSFGEEINTSPDEQFKLVLDQTELNDSPAGTEKQEMLCEFESQVDEPETRVESSPEDKPSADSAPSKSVFDMACPPFGSGNYSQNNVASDGILEKEISYQFSSQLPNEEYKISSQPEEKLQENLVQTDTDSELPKETVKSEETISVSENIASTEGEFETLETLVNEEPLIGTPVMNLSESMQEFTGLEEQLKPEQQAPLSNGVAEIMDTKVESQVIAVENSVEEKIVSDVDVKPDTIEKTENILSNEKTEPKTEESSVGVPLAVAATVSVAAAATAAASGVAKTTKAKAGVKAPPKTATTTATRTTIKSTPTSPTKAATATQRTTGTSVAKKPTLGTASRPKQLETAKTSSVTGTTNKSPAAKTGAAATKPTTLTKPTTARTSTLTAASKPKPTTTASRLSTATSTDKKPTTNGDAKPLSKTAASKPAARSLAGSASAPTKTLTKTSTATRSASGATAAPSKSRPASAATTLKPKVASTGATTTSTQPRPKSSPALGSTASAAPKLRSTLTKSPVTDKQTKETTNKQLSSARTSGSTLTKSTSRTSTTGTTTVAKRNLASKNPPPAAAQPQKKPAPITRPGGKLSSLKNAAKTTITSTTTKTTEVEVVQNGVSEVHETKTVLSSSTVEEDVPQKDVSPVTSSTDNQLIMTAD